MKLLGSAIRPATGPSPSGLLLGLLGVLVFSLTLPFTRLAVAGLDPLFAGAGRAVLAALLAGALLALRRVARPARRLVPRLAVVVAGVVAGFPLLTSWALQSVPAAHGAVVVGALPLATAAAGCLRGGERPPAGFWAASTAGFAAVLAFLAVGAGGLGGLHVPDLLLLAAVVLAAAGYAEGALLARELGAWQTTCWALVLALPLTVPLAVGGALRGGLSAEPSGWVAFGYLGVFSTFLGFFAWYRGLAIGPVSSVSQVQLVQPVFTLAWSALFFGEHVAGGVWAAAAVVVLCAGLAARRRAAGPAPGRGRRRGPPGEAPA
ncbi:DMT family transporter, partial [Kineococcus sp. SYSU DK006]|uniref:DMT family transporter n=1 Tax=Kineococcus sp. SYSU DK006 TaxID=3383127 RepID=UPI003D7EEB8C